MRIWADLHDSTWTKVGAGPVWTLRSASVTRALDGVGSISITAPLTDQRAGELLTNERRAIVYAEADGVTREIGRGILRRVRVSESETGYLLTADGPDELDELKRVNTLLARSFSAINANTAAATLVGLAAGWSGTYTIGESEAISLRYDGVTVWKALLELAAQKGVHVRAGTSSRTVEIGAFGSDAGLRIMNTLQMGQEVGRNDSVALIDTLKIQRDSEDVVNWLLPLGQGEGEAALTLARSTRSAPYTIQTTTGPDGRTLYYLSDAASIASFGTVQKVATFRQIGAISNSDTDLINAANALYDTAAAWLQRSSQRLDSYSVTLRKVRKTIRPGDKVRLVWRGIVTRDGVPYTYANIDADMWVMKVTERWGLEGQTVDLDVQTVDRQALDEAEIVVGALEAIEIQSLRVQTYPSVRSYVYRREVAPSFNATIPVEITSATTALQRARLRLVTRAFRVTATAAASGGGSTVTSLSGGANNVSTGSQIFGTSDVVGTTLVSTTPSSHSHTFTPGSHTHLSSIPGHTHSVTVPAHTHNLTYGINDDTETPTTISLWINGIDRTAALGGPWATSPGAINQVFDITTYLVNAAGGLRQAHTVEVRCTGGRGEIEATVELYETVQAIAV